MIRCAQVSVRFTGAAEDTLRGLDLTINRGEAVCLMGANGSGKSTLARLLAGLIRPTGGTCTIAPSGPDSGSRVGLLFQNPDNQMVAVTVEKELAFGLENRAVPMSQMKPLVITQAERFGITGLLPRLTGELSGGEKQRVALAATMITRPGVLLLDEPDSYLDEPGRRLLERELARLHAEQPDLIEIRITQYLSVARSYPRLVILNSGVVAADGPPDRLLSDTDLCRTCGLSPEMCPESATWPTNQERTEPNAVALRDVSYRYDTGGAVVSGISLTVARGEVVGLVGASGSGKSTLGWLWCGLIKAKSGSVLTVDADGKVRSPHPPVITGALQFPERQFFLPTVREELGFGPRNFGVTHTADDALRLLRIVGLSEQFLERDPYTLSAGEKRRLAFAVILAIRPSYVLFDEPTCGLDPSGVSLFLKLSADLRRQGIGQLVISHDRAVIAAGADRVICLESGRVTHDVPTATFLRSPAAVTYLSE